MDENLKQSFASFEITADFIRKVHFPDRKADSDSSIGSKMMSGVSVSATGSVPVHHMLAMTSSGAPGAASAVEEISAASSSPFSAAPATASSLSTQDVKLQLP